MEEAMKFKQWPHCVGSITGRAWAGRWLQHWLQHLTSCPGNMD